MRPIHPELKLVTLEVVRRVLSLAYDTCVIAESLELLSLEDDVATVRITTPTFADAENGPSAYDIPDSWTERVDLSKLEVLS